MVADAAGGGAGSGTPGSGAVTEDHRSGFGRHLHGGLQRRRAHREDHVDRLAHKLLHHQGGVGKLSSGVFLDEIDGFAGDVARLGQSRLKALAGVGGGRRIHHLQHADRGPLGLGSTAQFSAGRQHHGAHGSGTHQAQKLTTLQTHAIKWKRLGPLWTCCRAPAMPLD